MNTKDSMVEHIATVMQSIFLSTLQTCSFNMCPQNYKSLLLSLSYRRIKEAKLPEASSITKKIQNVGFKQLPRVMHITSKYYLALISPP